MLSIWYNPPMEQNRHGGPDLPQISAVFEENGTTPEGFEHAARGYAELGLTDHTRIALKYTSLSDPDKMSLLADAHEGKARTFEPLSSALQSIQAPSSDQYDVRREIVGQRAVAAEIRRFAERLRVDPEDKIALRDTEEILKYGYGS